MYDVARSASPYFGTMASNMSLCKQVVKVMRAVL